MLGLSVSEQSAQQALAEASGKGLRRCIFLLLTGGPSHLETFDPKPHAPSEIRGPFRAVSTATPGLFLSETLPRLAQRTDKVAVLRSLWHNATPIHETSQQLIQSGRLAHAGVEYPSAGSLVARLLGSRGNLPPYAVLPSPLGNTGVEMWQGQRAGCLGDEYDPWNIGIPDELALRESLAAQDADAMTAEMQAAVNWQLEPEHCRRSYGETRFGRSCLLARRLVEQGVRFVTVNMFDRLADQVTWDCHANGRWAPGGLLDYRDTLCPDFDRAFSALLDDLDDRGLLQETLVVATGEFGRTPRLNEFGGRDHWTGVWSAVLAGGGIDGGQIIGASDARGGTPADHPIHPAELTATVLHSLGIDHSASVVGPDGQNFPVADVQPIEALLA